MLLWRAWRESRTRFAISASLLALSCIVLVGFEAELRRRMITAHPLTFDGYIYSRIYGGLVRTVFLLLAVVLGLRGREHVHGTLGFTLALPVRRIDHAIARAAVGVLEVVALAAIPAVLVPGCAAIAGERYACTQAFEFALLWIAGGAVVFAGGMLVSSAIRTEYAALALAVVAVRLVPGPLGLDRAMSGRGTPYLDAHTNLLVGLPWLVIAAIATCASGLLVLAAAIAARERMS